MGFIRTHGVRFAVWLAVGLLIFFVASKMRNAERDAWESMFPIRKQMRLAQEEFESSAAERWELIKKQQSEHQTNSPKLWQGNVTQAANMTKEEREEALRSILRTDRQTFHIHLRQTLQPSGL